MIDLDGATWITKNRFETNKPLLLPTDAQPEEKEDQQQENQPKLPTETNQPVGYKHLDSSGIFSETKTMSLASPENLLTWLASPNSQPGAFLVYPVGYDESNVLAALLGILVPALTTGPPTLIMATNPEKVDEALGYSLANNYIPYGESLLLDQAIQQYSLIIVDSVILYRTLRIGEVARRKANACRFLVLGKFGFDNVDLSYLGETMPGITMLYGNFIDRHLRVVYHLEVSAMLPEQDRLFKERKVNEDYLALRGNSKEKFEAKQYLRSTQIGNFLYPNDIQRVLDLVSTSRPRLPRDELQPHGWISPNFLGLVQNYSPKLLQLLTVIMSRSQERHVIFTRYKTHYGAMLISSLIALAGIPTVLLTGDDKGQQRQNKIENFNQLQSGVLITTLIPDFDLYAVTNLHLLEAFKTENFQGLMSKIFKIQNYPQPNTTLNCWIYIAQQMDNTDGVDAISYRPFADQQLQQQEIYNRIVESSLPLKYDAVNNILQIGR